MKYLKKFEGFSPYESDPSRNDVFDDRSNLDKRFSEIIVSGLSNDVEGDLPWGKETGKKKGYWNTFSQLTKLVAKENPALYKELQTRVVDGEDTTLVMNDICKKIVSMDDVNKESLEELSQLSVDLNS